MSEDLKLQKVLLFFECSRVSDLCRRWNHLQTLPGLREHHRFKPTMKQESGGSGTSRSSGSQNPTASSFRYQPRSGRKASSLEVCALMAVMSSTGGWSRGSDDHLQ